MGEREGGNFVSSAYRVLFVYAYPEFVYPDEKRVASCAVSG